MDATFRLRRNRVAMRTTAERPEFEASSINNAVRKMPMASAIERSQHVELLRNRHDHHQDDADDPKGIRKSLILIDESLKLSIYPHHVYAASMPTWC